MSQNALTLITPTRPDQVESLKTLLEEIGRQISSHPLIPFNSLTTTHFCRWVLLEEDGFLAFESNYDGSLDDYLDEWIRLAGRGLEAIYSKCVGFPAKGAQDPSAMKSYLKKCCRPAATYYIAYRGETFKTVRNAIEIREKAEQYLDRCNADGSLKGKSGLKMVQEIRDFLAQEKVTFVKLPSRPPELNTQLTLFKLVLAIVFIVLPLLPLILLFLAIWYPLLRWHEMKDKREVFKYPVHVDPKLIAMEDRKVQNQMTHIVNIRPGLFRFITLKIVFWALNILAKYLFNKGNLGNIPTIHFARWVFLPKGRILFFSNFDGSWESYLGDFIDKASKGLTGVWSNTQGFPKTKNLVWEGALDETNFKEWARTYQIHTQVWFSAYPEHTVRNILNDREIRDGLASPSLDEEGALNLLRKFGRDPGRREKFQPVSPGAITPSTIDIKDVQGMILSGYGHQNYASYLFLNVKDGNKAKIWLGQQADNVTNGVKPDAEAKGKPHLNLALTAAGFRALGLSQEVLKSFSKEFQEGMADAQRARILGDTEESAPEKWELGRPGEPEIHILLMLFGQSPEILSDFRSKHQEGLASSGLEIISCQEAVRTEGNKEHFGFRDGISQPGIRDLDGKPESIRAGEFILGYPNEFGKFPLTPLVPKSLDKKGLLSEDPTDPGLKDFGKNGSYLVFRKLGQDVEGFWDYMAKQSQGKEGKVDEQMKAMLAAKCMGRWPSGAPIALSPEKDDPALGADDARNNAFGFAETDQRGYGCPMGSHIRRANPRDSLIPSASESTIMVNRHRIIRRGRTYEAGGKGIYFLAINSNIRRQFEFIQQAWINDPKFDGGYEAKDPITADDNTSGYMDIPQDPVRLRIAGMARFVHVKGGGYFFLPGIRALKFLGSL